MKAVKSIFGFVVNNFINLLVLLMNLFIWRTKKIWIFGSWFGESFSDNSRFLFQYVSNHKEKYGIKRAIWMTRSDSVFSELRGQNYDVMRINTLKGFFFHIRSGVHVICNNASFSGHKHDINTYLSFGAKKIQLWHGVGIKACGRLKLRRPNSLMPRLYYNFINRYGQPGMWGRCYQLVTSDENKRVAIQDFAIMPKKTIMAYYPRNCSGQILLGNEKEFIERLLSAKEKHKIILYLPTFRNDLANYIPPTAIEGFCSFLRDHNYVWIQKKHSADNNSGDFKEESCIINLDSKFDVNTLYDYVDLLITDYSSASSDAIAKNKMTLEYCPDYDYYKNEDRGFVNDFSLYHIGEMVTDPSVLFEEIERRIALNLNDLGRFKSVKSFLFGNKEWSIDEVCDQIVLQTKIIKHK